MGKRQAWVVIGHVVFSAFVLSGVTTCSGKGGEAGSKAGGSIAEPSERTREAAPAELLVKFKPGVSEERIRALARKHATTIKEVIEGINWYVLTIQGDRPPLEVVEALKREPEVEAAEVQGTMEIR